MEQVDKILKDLCDIITVLEMPERLEDEVFRERCKAKHKKVLEDIAILNPDEYHYLEKKYQEWFKLKMKGKHNESTSTI